MINISDNLNFAESQVYLGDNLGLLESVEDDLIDLIYLDPPYFSQKDYGDFEDTWEDISQYIEFMVPRIKQMYRILKSTGSIYLQCDCSAVHYLKVEMDKIFGMDKFRNDIVWCYNSPVNSHNYFSKKHDNILFYSKSDNWCFNDNDIRIPYGEWAKNKINYKTTSFGLGRAKIVELNECGMLCPDYWYIDFSSGSKERCGYKTQKPRALLERIIKASSNPGDIVLDPFCGSGTALVEAKKLRRNFIGFDIKEKAIEISEERLKEEYVSELNPLSRIFGVDI